jgi:hypothetical protein
MNYLILNFQNNGKPCDLRLIDFAAMREASPGMDISFFLYLSVSEEAVEGDGLRQLLSRYHAALVTTLVQLGGLSDPWRGDIDELEREVGRYALSAYCTCSFFLPVMMSNEMPDIKEFDSIPIEEQHKRNLELGGEETTQRLVNILLDCQKRGFHKLW